MKREAEIDFPKRKRTRLINFDYSRNGAYFITICTQDRKNILSSIVGEGLAPPAIRLTPYGEIAEEQLLLLKKRYSHIMIEKYVIMPNHIHVLLRLNDDTGGASPSPTVSDIVCTFKSLTSCKCRRKYGIQRMFQRSFYDHIIRNAEDYINIRNYIELNPVYWKKDCFYNQD